MRLIKVKLALVAGKDYLIANQPYIADASGQWERKLISITPNKLAVVMDRSFTRGGFILMIDDTDETYKTMLAHSTNRKIYGKTVTVYAYAADGVTLADTIIASVKDFRWEEHIFSIECDQEFTAKMSIIPAPLSSAFTAADWPNAPGSTIGKAVPMPEGIQSAPGGAVTAYLVNIIGDIWADWTTCRYVYVHTWSDPEGAARCSDVAQVFVEGVETAPGSGGGTWAHSRDAVNGWELITISPPPPREGLQEYAPAQITANGTYATESSASQNPVEVLETLLTTAGLTLVDESSNDIEPGMTVDVPPLWQEGTWTTRTAYANTATAFFNANQVWFKPTSTGGAGTGTLADPYDASTQVKFDALITTFENTKDIGGYPLPVTINLLAGTYETLGIHMWAYLQIVGAGMYLTIIKYVGDGIERLDGNGEPFVSNLKTVMNSLILWNARACYMCVADLTIDCSGFDGDTRQIAAISMWGLHDNIIERVRVINPTSPTPGIGSENFILWIAGVGDQDSYNNTIRDCIVEDGWGSMATSFCIAHIIGSYYDLGGIIERNISRNVNMGMATAYATKGLIIRNNYFDFTNRGINIDSGNNYDMLISGNIIKNTYYIGIRFGTDGVNDGCIIENNDISTWEAEDWGMLIGPNVTNLIIRGNKIYGRFPYPGSWAIKLDGTGNANFIYGNFEEYCTARAWKHTGQTPENITTIKEYVETWAHCFDAWWRIASDGAIHVKHIDWLSVTADATLSERNFDYFKETALMQGHFANRFLMSFNYNPTQSKWQDLLTLDSVDGDYLPATMPVEKPSENVMFAYAVGASHPVTGQIKYYDHPLYTAAAGTSLQLYEQLALGLLSTVDATHYNQISGAGKYLIVDVAPDYLNETVALSMIRLWGV